MDQSLPENISENFLSFIERNENDIEDREIIRIRKCSILYFLTTEKDFVSTDRNYRFSSNKDKKSLGEKIQLGDFVQIKLDDKIHPVQVLGFQYADGKKFMGDFFSFEWALKMKSTRKIEVFCSFFSFSKFNHLYQSKKRNQFIQVSCYQKHLFVKRDFSSGILTISE